MNFNRFKLSIVIIFLGILCPDGMPRIKAQEVNNQIAEIKIQKKQDINSSSKWEIKYLTNPFREVAQLRSNKGELVNQIELKELSENINVSYSEIKDEKLLHIARRNGLLFKRNKHSSFSADILFDGKLFVLKDTRVTLKPYPNYSEVKYEQLFSNWSESEIESIETIVSVFDNQNNKLWTKSFTDVGKINADYRNDELIFILFLNDLNKLIELDTKGQVIRTYKQTNPE